MSNVNQEQHFQSSGAIDRQRFPTDNCILLAQYMDKCVRMASLLASVRDDAQDGDQESLESMAKPNFDEKASKYTAHVISIKNTTVREGTRNTMDDLFASNGSRTSIVDCGGSTKEGNRSQGLKKETQSK